MKAIDCRLPNLAVAWYLLANIVMMYMLLWLQVLTMPLLQPQ